MSTIISETRINDYYSKARTLKKELGQEDFFKLMIEQLKNQDPTQPSNDLNQILNTATFGILEGVNSIRDAVADKKLNVFDYTGLVGKEITFEKTNIDPFTKEQVQVLKKAVVQGVSLQNDKIMLQVDDGIVFPDEIKQLDFQGQDKNRLFQDTMAYFSLVGKKVDYLQDEQAKSGLIDAVVLKNGVMEFTVGGEKISLDQITGVYNAE
ncbi:flagellar hook capping FlgD N-terminal domain-containing protein [Ammoniphilus resinae]|uniref:Basal-body rod modification protein FlgD n=1 Tax=Ammoniphilus resinae TaxID=861532 RepID=A0ABS4GQM9_9BACL|nr:flagellar hook capping FlgD N-terminal domain-containing protein [Ammoniphilus resinae]MBP1932580.1 flagellar hook assembly protein FlgD [Ammoniphilus resinae]